MHLRLFIILLSLTALQSSPGYAAKPDRNSERGPKGKDREAPVIVVPENMTVEATGFQGSVVWFEATATDNIDTQPSITCSPNSGALFPLGTSIVYCTATDSKGNASADSFDVSVVDTAPPVLDLPTNLLYTTAEEGVQVEYTASAFDLVDAGMPVTCDPISGSWFTVGETIVNCSATDSSGNQATGVFQVTILSEAVHASTDGSFHLAWDSPTHRENGEPILEGELYGYRIHVIDPAQNWDEEILLTDAGDTTYQWISPGSGSYEISVSAIDVFGFESQPSTSITGIVP